MLQVLIYQNLVEISILFSPIQPTIRHKDSDKKEFTPGNGIFSVIVLWRGCCPPLQNPFFSNAEYHPGLIAERIMVGEPLEFQPSDLLKDQSDYSLIGPTSVA
jgi:hypothetical protein